MRIRLAAWSVAALVVPLACARSENQVVGIDYTVSEFPGGGKVAWSCLAEGYIDGRGAAAIGWTVGSPLVATPTPRFEQACGGWLGSPCPDPQMVMTPLDASVWTLAVGPKPGSFFGGSTRYLEAISAGTGGMKAQAQGRAFPPLEVHALAPTGFRYFLVVDTTSLTPIVGHLVVTKDAKLTVVPQLVSATGPLCGFPAMVVNATGPVVEPDPTWNPEGRANAPVSVTGGAAGTIEFSAGGVTGSLVVDSI